MTNFMTALEKLYKRSKCKDCTKYGNPQRNSNFIIEKQRRFFVDNLMLSVQLADVSTRCSSHPQGKSGFGFGSNFIVLSRTDSPANSRGSWEKFQGAEQTAMETN